MNQTELGRVECESTRVGSVWRFTFANRRTRVRPSVCLSICLTVDHLAIFIPFESIPSLFLTFLDDPDVVFDAVNSVGLLEESFRF